MPRQDKPKKRNEYIYATTKGDVTELSVTVNELTGEISFGSEMTNVYSEVNYDRLKGPKVLSRLPQADTGLSFDAAPAIGKNYDSLFAVDTNTRTIQGKLVSVVGIVQSHTVWIPEAKGLTRYARFDVPVCLEYVGIKSKPENFGWAAAIGHLQQLGRINKDQRVGLVVDSDLSNIPAYNQRSKPYIGSDLLPPYVTLIYATADSGKEYFLNKFFAVADSVSSQCLDAVETGIIPFNDRRVTNPWFEGLRLLYPDQ